MSHSIDHDEQLATAAAWVLGALPAAEAASYAAHLASCAACRAEVARLQPVADVMPLAAPPAQPPPELKARIMAEVEREAALLAAAGAEADRPPRLARRDRGRAWGWLARQPVWVAAATALVLGVGVALGVMASSGDDEATGMRAAVTSMAPAGGTHGELLQEGRHAELRVDDVPPPAPGRVYQVWIVRGGRAAPDAVFTVDRDGDGSVVLEGDVTGADQVLITDEPAGGSRNPTSKPSLGATLS